MQNTIIYPELDRIRRAAFNAPTLLRVCPYTSTMEVEADMISLQRMLHEQLVEDNERMSLTIYNEGRKIYIIKESHREGP